MVSSCCGKRVSPAYYVKNVIKHGQDGRGTLYLVFYNRNYLI